MRTTCCTIATGANTGNVTGAAIDTSQLYQGSFQVVNGDVTAVGTVKLQMSNDQALSANQAPFVPTNWTDILSASIAVAAGVAANPIELSNMKYRWIRAVYTRTSGGSTTISVQMNAQGF
jgi:hypothetical protein